MPASAFSFDALAEIYNQARVDYIVPMPMNGKRMAEYVQYYDVSLEGSFVSYNNERLETGIGMLGLRGTRGWITRLGVLPERREAHIGSYIVEAMIDYAISQGVTLMQLEVILGNTPAHRLFLKLGFEETRQLLVVRRPPSRLKTDVLYPRRTDIEEIPENEIPHLLQQRTERASWLDENASLLNTRALRGYRIMQPTDAPAWVIFQRQPFQLAHFAFGGTQHTDSLIGIMRHIHTEYAMQDTKIENLPIDSPVWPVLQNVGYLEVFRRIEMFMTI
jgi:ribosomal protein S18 acetylase RimI-like enzyme